MKKNSFVEGTIIATLAIVFVKLLGMLYVIPFYRIVGSTGGALYSYAYNIYMIFLGISSAGLPSAISKIISEYNTLGYEHAKNRAYVLAKKIISVFSVCAFLILFIFAPLIAKFIVGDLSGGNSISDVALVIRFVSPAVLVIPFLSITKGYLQGHKYIGPSSNSQLIEQVIRILVILVGSYFVLKVFNGKLSIAVGIAVSGAFIGGIAAYLYLRFAIKKYRKNLVCEEKCDDSKINDKEIIKKIIAYAIPFVIINVVTNIYTFTDQILVIKTLNYLKFDANTTEFIASSISTWSPKICMIINAMAMGMTMSLIPAIVSAFAKKDNKDVSNKVNKALSMIIYISVPLVIGLIILAHPVWYIFYSTNPSVGSMILRLALVSAMLANVYMVISTILQSLNDYKMVYFVSILGFATNALCDVPLMLLFNYLSLPAYLGSVVSSILGFSLSIIIGLISIHKKNKINFSNTLNVICKSVIPSLCMILVLFIFNYFIHFNQDTKGGALMMIAANAILGAPVFIYVSFKLGLLDTVFGKDMVDKILKKITLGKYKG